VYGGGGVYGYRHGNQAFQDSRRGSRRDPCPQACEGQEHTEGDEGGHCRPPRHGTAGEPRPRCEGQLHRQGRRNPRRGVRPCDDPAFPHRCGGYHGQGTHRSAGTQGARSQGACYPRGLRRCARPQQGRRNLARPSRKYGACSHRRHRPCDGTPRRHLLRRACRGVRRGRDAEGVHRSQVANPNPRQPEPPPARAGVLSFPRSAAKSSADPRSRTTRSPGLRRESRPGL
jgi:hypothetical protein